MTAPLPGRDHYVRLEADLVVLGDSIITDRHHASAGNYEADDPQNKIEGIIPAYPLSGWLRHGMEKVVQHHGATACHPSAPSAGFKKQDVYDRDLADGYHECGACVTAPHRDDGCVLFDLFGGFNDDPGTLLRRPIRFSPIRSNVDYADGQAEGHYRRLNRNIVSRNTDDGGEPLRNTGVDAIANLDGTWYLSFRDPKPEFVGLLAQTVEFLDAHAADYMYQLGGSRNFGGGVVDVDLCNPLYTDQELRRVFDRRATPTDAMTEKDAKWETTHREQVDRALQARIDGRSE